MIALAGVAAGGFALGAPLVARAQQPAAPAPAPAPVPGAAPGVGPAAGAGQPDDGKKDYSRDGTARRDTVVLRPKDGDRVSVRLPKQGVVTIASQIPWAVVGGKKGTDLEVEFDVRGIKITHTGSGSTRISFDLRLIDGRTVTVNVRTATTKYQVGYAIIT